jgi:hypothetical protein
MQLCLRLSSKRLLHWFQPRLCVKCIVQRDTHATTLSINAAIGDEQHNSFFVSADSLLSYSTK